MTIRRLLLTLLLLVPLGIGGRVALEGWPAALLPARATAEFITLATTTGTEGSGLFPHLLPAFTRDTGIGVRVVTAGTGQVLQLGERGDADVLLVHGPDAGLRFVADGWGVERREVMSSGFILIGPKSDPAGVAGGKDAVAAFRDAAAAQAPFITRGDGSATNAAELRLWAAAGVDPRAASASTGWYKDIGGDMGQALTAAAVMGAYTLSGRSAWLGFTNRQDLAALVEGDGTLSSRYAAVLVNPERHPAVKAAPGRAFIAWLASPAGQGAIAGYRIGGEQPFSPSAGKSGA